MEWINIIQFSLDHKLEMDQYYFLYDADAIFTVNREKVQIPPKVAMYKGGGKFIGDQLEILLIEDFTHAIKFEPPKI